MRQDHFEAKYSSQWREFTGLLDDLDKSKQKRKATIEQLTRLPWLYRAVCNHYAVANSRHYSPGLLKQLHELVLRGHQRLYSRRGAWLWRSINFIAAVFPQTVRKHARYFWLASLLFYGPAFILGILCYNNPNMIYSVMDGRQIAQMEYMYDPANKKIGREEGRSSDTDVEMFGFYIRNNIGVGFRTFAGGILFGIGTVFFLLYNGVVIGGVAGHLTRLEYHETFWTFVSGHGSFELTAIVISGAAGLLLAHAVIAPGQYTRSQALKHKASRAVTLVLGAALMLVLAAFVEAFWSSSGFSGATKYSVAAGLWLIVIGYLLFAGRMPDATR